MTEKESSAARSDLDELWQLDQERWHAWNAMCLAVVGLLVVVIFGWILWMMDNGDRGHRSGAQNDIPWMQK